MAHTQRPVVDEVAEVAPPTEPEREGQRPRTVASRTPQIITCDFDIALHGMTVFVFANPVDSFSTNAFRPAIDLIDGRQLPVGKVAGSQVPAGTLWPYPG